MREGEESASFANPTVINVAGTSSAYRFDKVRKDSIRTAELGLRSRFRTGTVAPVLSSSLTGFWSQFRNAYTLSNFAGFEGKLNESIQLTPLRQASGSEAQWSTLW